MDLNPTRVDLNAGVVKLNEGKVNGNGTEMSDADRKKNHNDADMNAYIKVMNVQPGPGARPAGL